MKNVRAAERRRSYRVPAKISLKVKDMQNESLSKARSVDLTPYGAQIESDISMQQEQQIEIWPDDNSSGDNSVTRATVKWVKSHDGKFRSGIAFDEKSDWLVNIAALVDDSGPEALGMPLLNAILMGVEDGIIILDDEMKIVAANPAQPFCPQIRHDELPGRYLGEVSNLQDAVTSQGRLTDIIQSVFQTGEARKVHIDGVLRAVNGQDSQFSLYLRPVTLPGNKSGVMLRARNIASFYRLQDEIDSKDEDDRLLKYKYITLGQLFDGLIEDMVNPISAAVGRLDLMSIKLETLIQKGTGADVSHLEALSTDVNAVQAVLMQVTEFCKAAIRRRKDPAGTNRIFSINTLIEDELRTLELHSNFRKINKKLSINRELPLIEGDYSDWVNAFIALCQAIIRRVAAMHHKELEIKTYAEDGYNVLSFTHNGKALPLNLENDPTLSILKLLQQKYGAVITAYGTTGNQTISIKIKPVEMSEKTNGKN